jgi:molybdopterin molybdotransferase
MISVAEAYTQVLSKTLPQKTKKIPLSIATASVLAEDIYADQDFPPFNRVMMDGIALDLSLLGQKEIPVKGMQTAGSPQQEAVAGTCIEVMTGAILPTGTNVVIPYEEIVIHNQKATIQIKESFPLKNVHLKGTDRKKGDLLIPKGRRIGPAEIAVLATVGKSSVLVSDLSVAIISTGDELVDIDTVPHPYQIRSSNSHMLHSLITRQGMEATCYHLHDDKENMLQAMKDIFNQHSIIILSGGVSKGKKDYVPDVLQDLGVEKHFHRVAQRPGKPFWFGSTGQHMVFALPGNPVSTFLCFQRYVWPWMQQYSGEKISSGKAKLGEDFQFGPDLTYFLQVKVTEADGMLTAHPVAGKGSGDLANLLEADGFLELPPDRENYPAGEAFHFIPFRKG